MKNGMKWLFTGMSAVLIVLGVLAIVTKTYTVSSRFLGMRTGVGDDAVWFGKTCLLVAVLPLIVWVPSNWVGVGVSLWWLALMAWLFIPFFLR